MKKKVQIEEARLKFNEILDEALRGKEVIIMDENIPVARLVRIESAGNAKKENRWTTDDFNIQLDEEL